MRQTALRITEANSYSDIFLVPRQELISHTKMPCPLAYKNPKGSDISFLNQKIRIVSKTKCDITESNLYFRLKGDGSGVVLCISNFSIEKLFGNDGSVIFETFGHYNYRERFEIRFNVVSEFIGIDVSEGEFIYSDAVYRENNALMSFDVVARKETENLKEWQYTT